MPSRTEGGPSRNHGPTHPPAEPQRVIVLHTSGRCLPVLHNAESMPHPGPNEGESATRKHPPSRQLGLAVEITRRFLTRRHQRDLRRLASISKINLWVIGRRLLGES